MFKIMLQVADKTYVFGPYNPKDIQEIRQALKSQKETAKYFGLRPSDKVTYCEIYQTVETLVEHS